MIEVRRLKEYSPEVAGSMRRLLIDLSRSGKDKGEIAKEWFEEVIASPLHEILLAYEGEEVVGMMSLSVVMGPGIRKNAYLEDFVTASDKRGLGVGNALWTETLKWAKEKGCKRLEFTCGNGRETAQKFYKKHGAEVYDTNFFRFELNK